MNTPARASDLQIPKHRRQLFGQVLGNQSGPEYQRAFHMQARSVHSAGIRPNQSGPEYQRAFHMQPEKSIAPVSAACIGAKPRASNPVMNPAATSPDPAVASHGAERS